MAPVVIPAIIVMDKTTYAFSRGAAGYRQAGRLIGQETDSPEILDCLACAEAFTHFDTMVIFSCVLPCSGR